MATTSASLDFQTLHDRFRSRVLRYLTRLVGEAEAEDLTQSVMLRVSEGLHDFRGDSSLSTWIYRIAHNLSVDRLRRRRETSGGVTPDELPGSERPSGLFLERQVADAVQQALLELPERQRAAIGLVHYQGLSNMEAAEVLGVGVRALESLLARARRQLKESLAALAPVQGSEP